MICARRTLAKLDSSARIIIDGLYFARASHTADQRRPTSRVDHKIIGPDG